MPVDSFQVLGRVMRESIVRGFAIVSSLGPKCLLARAVKDAVWETNSWKRSGNFLNASEIHEAYSA